MHTTVNRSKSKLNKPLIVHSTCCYLLSGGFSLALALSLFLPGSLSMFFLPILVHFGSLARIAWLVSYANACIATLLL